MFTIMRSAAVLLLCMVGVVLAADAGKLPTIDPGSPVIVASDAGAIGDAGAMPAAEGLIDQGKTAYDKTRDAVTAPSFAKIAAAVGACLFLLLGLARKFLPFAVKGHTLRVITLIIGLLATAAIHLADASGLSWWQALLAFFLAGPGSMALAELLKLVGVDIRDNTEPGIDGPVDPNPPS